MEIGDKVRVGPTAPTIFTLLRICKISGVYHLITENGYEFEFSGELFPDRRYITVAQSVDRRK